MIVYANEFCLKAEDGDLSILKQAIKTWMGKKIGPAFRNTKIIPCSEPFRVRREDTGPNEVMIIGTTDHADDYSLSINYRHNDAVTQGRAWFTRIGIERQGGGNPLHVTVLLETSEVSPQRQPRRSPHLSLASFTRFCDGAPLTTPRRGGVFEL